MRKLVVREYPISIKITGNQGQPERRTAIIQEVLEGVSDQFLQDIQIWLESHAKEEQKDLPVVVLYHGGMKFPLSTNISAHGHASVHLINVDRGEG